MANYYVNSVSGNNANDGLSWTGAKATISGALTGCVGGDYVFVSPLHQEYPIGKNVTIFAQGTTALPINILCVNQDTEPPTGYMTGATINPTGSLSYSGYAYCQGINFIVGTGEAAAASHNWSLTTSDFWWKLENCKVQINNNASNSLINIGTMSSTKSQYLEFQNTIIRTKQVNQGIHVNSGKFIWQNTASGYVGLSGVNILMSAQDGFADGTEVKIKGLDLSSVGNLINSTNTNLKLRFENCSFRATSLRFPFQGNIAWRDSNEITMINCDSSGTNYRYLTQTYNGIVSGGINNYRINGASDGSQNISYKMESTQFALLISPLKSQEFAVWNTIIGTPINVTGFYMSTGNLYNDDIGITVEYQGISGSTQSVFISSKKACLLDNNRLNDISTQSWSTGNIAGATFQQCVVSGITCYQTGLIRAVFELYKPSTTVYVCPKIEVGP